MWKSLLWSAWIAWSSTLAQGDSIDPSDLMERAVSWIEGESEWNQRFDYLTGGEIRLLVVWVGEDDAGRGYIRLGRKKNQPELETISLLFGSIPERAPRDLNRWGAAIETLNRDPESGDPVASAFLGFRKSSADVEAARTRGKSNAGEGRFEASLNYVGPDRAVSRVLLIEPGKELNLHEMERVQGRALRRFENVSEEPPQLDRSGSECSNVSGFLFTMRALFDDIASGTAPHSRCYIYNARVYTVSVKSMERIESRDVTLELESGEELKRHYQDLVDLELETLNHETGNTTSFDVAIGTRDPLKGVPVEILYQPSTWVRIKIQLRATKEGKSR